MLIEEVHAGTIASKCIKSYKCFYSRFIGLERYNAQIAVEHYVYLQIEGIYVRVDTAESTKMV